MNAGRKLAFSKEEALDAALEVFWKKGYENTKLTDLTESMKINKPSLYNSFGNKEDLFIEALTYYQNNILSHAYEILKDQTKSEKDRLYEFLNKVIFIYSEAYSNYGCMLANSFVEVPSSDMSEETKDTIKDISNINRKVLNEFFEKGIAKGRIKDYSIDSHTELLLSTLTGIAFMIRGSVMRNIPEVIDMMVGSICK